MLLFLTVAVRILVRVMPDKMMSRCCSLSGVGVIKSGVGDTGVLLLLCVLDATEADDALRVEEAAD